MTVVATVARRWFSEWAVFTVAETNSLRLEDSQEADELCDILGDKDRARVVKLKQVPQNSSSRPEHFAVVWDRRQHGDPDRRVIQAIMACLRLKRNTVLLAAVEDDACIPQVLTLLQPLLRSLTDSVIVLTPTTACPGRQLAFAKRVLCDGPSLDFLYGSEDGEEGSGVASRADAAKATGSDLSDASGSIPGEVPGLAFPVTSDTGPGPLPAATRSTGSLGFLPGDSEQCRPESRAEVAWERAGGCVSPSGRAIGAHAGAGAPDPVRGGAGEKLNGSVPEPVVAAFEKKRMRHKGLADDNPSVSTAVDSTGHLQPVAFRVIVPAPRAATRQFGSLESLAVTNSAGKVNGRLSRGTPFTDLSSQPAGPLDTAGRSSSTLKGPPSRTGSRPGAWESGPDSVRAVSHRNRPRLEAKV